MADKKEKAPAKKAGDPKDAELDKLRKQHPFETDSQIENRYGTGRQKSGSDGGHQDGRGSNH